MLQYFQSNYVCEIISRPLYFFLLRDWMNVRISKIYGDSAIKDNAYAQK